MQKIVIPIDASPDEITTAVETKFSAIKEVAQHGFRPLRVSHQLKKDGSQKKGQTALLQPLKGTKEINIVNWQRCAVYSPNDFPY